MPKEQAEAFVENLKESETMSIQLKNKLGIEDGDTLQSEEHGKKLINNIVEFANEKNYEFTANEYCKVLMEHHQENSQLSDEQLEQISGSGADAPQAAISGLMVAGEVAELGLIMVGL